MTEQLHVSSHPLVKHKLTVLRDINTDHRTFRELVRELALLLCYEATLDLELSDKEVETPMGKA
ncbi:MAG: uracil phosphoribosyltransferase, partial [Phototrophicales bacterium]